MDLIDSLEKFLKSFRDMYEKLELNAKNFCGNIDYNSTTDRLKERNKWYDVNPSSVSKEVAFSLRGKFRCETVSVTLD